MDDKEFIKNFMEIKVARICKELGISKTNISSGKASKKTYQQLREEIDRRLDKLYE